MSVDEATRAEAEALVAVALAEDIGEGDLTSLATVPEAAMASALISQKQPGVIFGLDVAELAFRSLDRSLELERLAPEGQWRGGGEVLRASGSARALLSAERTALNLLGSLSGVATLAARYAKEVEGTGAQVIDTRKTTPGMRRLEKEAVRAGGAGNHRVGLWDEILIKDNHIAAAGGIGPAVAAARVAYPDVPLEVECVSFADIDEALAAGAERLLLDNMGVDELQGAVAHVDGRAVLEASGGVSLETVRAVAQTGVQFVSIGAMTHSAPALDLSMALELSP
ncbi:MAG: carboxylating nicotinate-nucleotide diphosphorylase [Solirubrobacteraceae bacterium]|nr:carboxylating nicotinate-nucleotide diphosphorylase [Solirubrobacteraceae bacterium]